MDIRDVVMGSFGLPADVMLDIPRIMMIGRGQIFVENYITLAEYKRDIIRLTTKLGVLEISGSGFEITVMKDKNIAITGKLNGLRLI